MSKAIVDRDLLWLSGIEQAELIRSRQVSARGEFPPHDDMPGNYDVVRYPE